MGNTRPSTGTGSPLKNLVRFPTNLKATLLAVAWATWLHLSNPSLILALPSRFVKQWVLVWNGYDGQIYISSAPTLADRVFEPARVLVEKATDQEKNW